MSEQYFTKAPSSAHDARQVTFSFRGKNFSFETDSGTFSRDHVDAGTQLLLKSLPADFEGRALDLGCGWGPVGCCMAALFPRAQVVMCDVNQRALELSRKNLAANSLRAQTFESDGLDCVEGEFDLIVTNPPIRAGKHVIYRLFAQSASRLRQGGMLLLVIRTRQGADSAQKFLETLFSSVSVVERGGGFKVLCAQGPLSAVEVPEEQA